MHTIITNNIPRDLITWHELSMKEREDFDYIESGDDCFEYRFFRYKGNVYDVYEFISGMKGWDACASDTFFSGTCIRMVYDEDKVIVGRYYA
jgi:hypothetical protein